MKQVLTVILGHADFATQREHLERGALFLPEPEPLPEPFAEILLRVEDAAGVGVDLDGRVLQILPGRGIAVSFDDLPAARRKLAPLLASAGAADDSTFIYWGRGTMKKISAPPPNTIPAPPPVAESTPPLELNEAATLEAEIAAMSPPQKIQLAMKGDRTARMLLLKDPNKALQGFLLQNPRITAEEVKHLAAYRQASPEALNAIASSREWSRNPAVVGALVRNPKTPGALAAKLLDALPMAEVRRLAKSNDVPAPVMAAARKKVAADTK
jgi:hypothetical protein